MPSKDNEPTAVVIPFSTSKKAAPRAEADLSRVSAGAEMHELCRDTRRALQELRHGVVNVLFDILERMEADSCTFVPVTAKSSAVVTELIDRETDDLTTEMLIDCLERLTSHLQTEHNT